MFQIPEKYFSGGRFQKNFLKNIFEMVFKKFFFGKKFLEKNYFTLIYSTFCVVAGIGSEAFVTTAKYIMLNIATTANCGQCF